MAISTNFSYDSSLVNVLQARLNTDDQTTHQKGEETTAFRSVLDHYQATRLDSGPERIGASYFLRFLMCGLAIISAATLL